MDVGGSSECVAEVIVEVMRPQAVLEAIEPDNISAPPHVHVKCVAGDRYLTCMVSIEGCRDNPSRILTLRNTIDDLISSVKVAVSTLKAVEEVGENKY